MARFYGAVGYASLIESAPGVWKEVITEHMYYGEVLRNTRKLQNSENLNDDINVSNEISIIADPFAFNNFHNIRYVKFMDTKWKVPSTEVKYPRLILTMGGIYNG